LPHHRSHSRRERCRISKERFTKDSNRLGIRLKCVLHLPNGLVAIRKRIKRKGEKVLEHIGAMAGELAV